MAWVTELSFGMWLPTTMVLCVRRKVKLSPRMNRAEMVASPVSDLTRLSFQVADELGSLHRARRTPMNWASSVGWRSPFASMSTSGANTMA